MEGEEATLSRVPESALRIGGEEIMIKKLLNRIAHIKQYMNHICLMKKSKNYILVGRKLLKLQEIFNIIFESFARNAKLTISPMCVGEMEIMFISDDYDSLCP